MRKILLVLLALTFSLAPAAFAAQVGSFVADEPFRAYAAITPSDTTTYGISGATNPRPIAALYLANTATFSLVLVGQDGATATFINLQPGTILFVSPLKIAAATTVTGILALYR